MDNRKLRRLLDAYQKGQCTEQERALIEAWLNKPLGDSQEHDDIDWQLRSAKLKIDKSINGDDDNVLQFSAHRSRHWWGIAAGLAVFIVCAIVTWRYISKPQQQVAAGHVKQWVDKGWLNVSVPKGKRYTLTLSDGSTVSLNAFSRLRCPVKFVNHKRPVYLEEGEGLFNVAKDKASPFTVYARNFATTALGTAFNIRAYSSEHKISISLIHGKIRVEDLLAKKQDLKTHILLPHQQLVINKSSGRLIKDSFSDENEITGWKNGLLIFHDASADEVISAVENRFGVRIVNECERKEWSYTGTFKNESLDEVLSTICLTEGIKFSNTKNNIVLN